MLHFGAISPHTLVLHKCDNPPCVNPSHLFTGTTAMNVADKMAKQRQPRGSEIATAKLVEADIPRIRHARAAGKTLKEVAADFSVHFSLISLIDRGLIWRHVQ